MICQAKISRASDRLLMVENGSIRFDFDVFLFNVAEFCYHQNHTTWERNSQIIHRIDLTNQVHNQNILFLTINLWYWSNIVCRSTHSDQRVKNTCVQVCKSVKIIHIPFANASSDYHENNTLLQILAFPGASYLPNDPFSWCVIM